MKYFFEKKKWIGIVCLALIAIGWIFLSLIRDPREANVERENYEDLESLVSYSMPERDTALAFSLNGYPRGTSLDDSDLQYAVSEFGEVYLYMEAYQSIHVFHPNGSLEEVIHSEYITDSTQFYFDLENHAIYMSYPVERVDRVYDPINIAKYSTLTKDIEYVLPANLIFTDFFNHDTYKLHGFKAVNGAGDLFVDLEKRTYDESGYSSTYEVALINSKPQIVLLEKESKPQGVLIGFSQDHKGNETQYNLLEEKGKDVEEFYLIQTESDGKQNKILTGWKGGSGEVLGVDKRGFIYFLRYNNEDFRYPELLKYDRNMEMTDSMDIFIPFNKGDSQDAVMWERSFLTRDGDLYYSFIDLNQNQWKLLKFSFQDKFADETPKSGPQLLETSYETYSDESISFRYPSLLTLEKTQNLDSTSFSLKKTIAFEHFDTCNMRGDAMTESLESFDIFNMNITLADGDLSHALPEWMQKYVYAEKNSLILADAFIEVYNTETLEGYSVDVSSEYCGSQFYIFPVSGEKTLVIERIFGSNPRYSGEYELTDELSPIFFENIFSSITIHANE